jgi:hypothetical protein
MLVDVASSTVTLAGRVFPACGLICPETAPSVRVARIDPAGTVIGESIAVRTVTMTINGRTETFGQAPSSEWSRSLGGRHEPTGDWHVFIPCENGVLVSVEEGRRNGEPAGLDIMLYSWHCTLDRSSSADPYPLFIPNIVSIRAGVITEEPVRGPFGVWSWDRAEDEWVAEHIARIAAMSTDLDRSGPRARAIPLAALVALVPA